MSKSVRTPVSPKTVRTAFAEGQFTAPDEALPSLLGRTAHGPRGRLHPVAVEAYEAQFPKFTVVEKEVSNEPTITLTPTRRDKAGRIRRLKAREVPVSEVRALAGTPGKRGRVSKADIEAAEAALGAK